MSVKVVTYFRTLCNKARALAEAKETGDPELIKKAQKDHDEYKELCLTSDELII